MLVKRRNTSTGARISTTVIKQEWPEESAEAEKLPASTPQEGLIRQPEPVPIRIKQECSEAPDQAETLHESMPLSLVKSEVPDSQEEPVSIQQQAEPVSNQIKKLGSEESDEAETVQESTPEGLEQNEVPGSEEGLVLNVEPISTFIKLEGYDGSSEAKNVKEIRSVLGSEIPEFEVLRALSQCGGDRNAAINFILENAGAIVVKNTNTGTGARISTQVNQGADSHNSFVKKEVPDCEVISVKQVRPQNLEDGDFPTERDWLLVGGTLVTALSTSKGRKLVDNEIVNLSFPSVNSSNKTRWIVRFSTKRSGEVFLHSMIVVQELFFLVDSFCSVKYIYLFVCC
jgi:DNA repair protein RAD5